MLALADIAAFGRGWESARGCCVEHKCRVEYGVTTIEL